MVETNTVWRDYATDGVPSSGAHKPLKSDIREWGAEMPNLSRKHTWREVVVGSATDDLVDVWDDLGQDIERIQLTLPAGVITCTRQLVHHMPRNVVIAGNGMGSTLTPTAVSIAGSAGAYDVTFTVTGH